MVITSLVCCRSRLQFSRARPPRKGPNGPGRRDHPLVTSAKPLTQKWERELDHALRKELWAFGDGRIAVRFQYESRDPAGPGCRALASRRC
jgi:Protein of unknown function (DUF1348)